MLVFIKIQWVGSKLQMFSHMVSGTACERVYFLDFEKYIFMSEMIFVDIKIYPELWHLRLDGFYLLII